MAFQDHTLMVLKVAIKLGLNIASLQAQRRIAESSEELSKIYGRLSSGLRINAPSDDAASLAIATQLKSQSRVFGQAIRNANDGLSAAGIAQSALEQLQNISFRQRELATQAANGSYTTKQRQAMNSEANQLVEEFNRILASTEFNGQKLLSKTEGFTIQAGTGADATLSLDFASALARNVGDGTLQTPIMFTSPGNSHDVALGDFNADGKQDLLELRLGDQKIVVRLGNGDGTFQAEQGTAYGGTGGYAITTGDFNGDGKLDTALSSINEVIIYKGNGDGTFQLTSSFLGVSMARTLVAGDLNGDSKLDLVCSESAPNGGPKILLGNGDGTFASAQTLSSSTGWSYDVTLGDFNNDGKIDLVSADNIRRSFSLFLGHGDGTFESALVASVAAIPGMGSLEVGDFNLDGNLDVYGFTTGANYLFLGNGDGTFKAQETSISSSDGVATDMNGDGITDIVTESGSSGLSVWLGTSTGSFKLAANYSSYTGIENTVVGDLDRDGRPDIATAQLAAGIGLFLPNGTQVNDMPYLNIANRQGALDALAVIDSTMQRVLSQIGTIGAAQSRLNIAVNTLSATRDNYEAAASRITDADMAVETAALLSAQIKQQAAVSILAQANLQPQLVLTLIRH